MSGEPLYLRWLWWKHTWTFQAAHKPLCDRFHNDVLRLGGLRLCRSCTALWGCFVLTLFAAPWYVHSLTLLSGVALLLFATAIVWVSAPTRYGTYSRPVRDLLRSGTGVTGALSIAHLLSPAWPIGLLLVIGLGVAWHTLQRVRRSERQQSDLCAGCAELGRPGICSGYRLSAERIRAYEEEATLWMERDFELKHIGPASEQIE